MAQPLILLHRHEENNIAARKLFHQALHIDPNFSRAYAGLAQTYMHGAVTGYSDHEIEEMLQTAKRAVECDDRDYFAHAALGTAHLFNRNVSAATLEFEEALRINPNSAFVHSSIGVALLEAGNAEEAMKNLQLAIQLSPADPSIGPFYGRMARAAYFIGDYEETIVWAQKAFQKSHAWPARAVNCAALAQLGRDDEASLAIKYLDEYQPGITLKFVEAHMPLNHRPYMDHILDGLRKAGVPEG